MACGGCGRRRTAPKSSGPACKKCGWPLRTVYKFSLKTRRNEASTVCTNRGCGAQG